MFIDGKTRIARGRIMVQSFGWPNLLPYCFAITWSSIFPSQTRPTAAAVRDTCAVTLQGQQTSGDLLSATFLHSCSVVRVLDQRFSCCLSFEGFIS
jgi:hypothetical protein